MDTIGEIDRRILIAEATAAAREAAALQMRDFRSRAAGWGDEKAKRDLVSHVDIECEKAIRERLSHALPEAGFYGEESGRDFGERWTWVVDPLDGTTNYLSGFDHFCVSIALFGPSGPEIGVILKPSAGELFAASRGGGAFRNGARLPRAPSLPLASALVATGTPYRSGDVAPDFWRAADRVMNSCRDLRRPGSAALDLAYLAAGFFQGFFETDLKPYDVGAALLMLEETGVPFSDFGNGPYDPFSSRTLAAAFPGAFDELIAILQTEYAIR